MLFALCDFRKERGLNRDEMMGGMVIFLFGAVTAILSSRMPLGTFRAAGTGLFPLCLGILLMILSGFFLLNLWLEQKKLGEKGAMVKIPAARKQMLYFLGLIVLTILFFNQLGYPLTSFLLMLGLLRILGLREWTINLPLSFVTAAASYFLFVQWLKIPLPKGWIGL